MENKSEGNEHKKILWNFNCTMDKMDQVSENKTERLYRCGFILPCQNSLRIMGSRIYGEGKTQISLSLPTTVDPLAQDPG